MAKKENVVWKQAKSDIVGGFIDELCEFTRSGTIPEHADQDLRYSMELQKKRLKRKNLKLRYEMTKRGHFAEGGGITISWKDERYTSRMEYRSCRLLRIFEQNGKRCYKKTENMNYHQITTDVLDQQRIGDDIHVCPNCGAENRIKDLAKGCPYCNTFFDISDIFPRVSNYYFVGDVGGTEKEVKHSVAKVVIPCMLLTLLWNMFRIGKENLANGEAFFQLQTLLSVLTIGNILVGCIIGYIIFVFFTLGRMIVGTAKVLPMLVNSAGSSKKFVSQMKRYSPEFSYEYFTGKVVSMLKMLIFSDEIEELPIYEGKPFKSPFDDIVDSSYRGAAALKKFQVQNGYCHVLVDVYMEDIYCRDGKMSVKNDIYHLHLCKDITKPINYHFSVKNIQCKSCCGSFDATKQKTCPFCGGKYNLSDDDWAIISVKKR